MRFRPFSPACSIASSALHTVPIMLPQQAKKACEVCADFCNDCVLECAQIGEDGIMRDCAVACRECAAGLPPDSRPLAAGSGGLRPFPGTGAG
jgi:hypothetical protein